jgi:hypothetical protein
MGGVVTTARWETCFMIPPAKANAATKVRAEFCWFLIQTAARARMEG